MDPFPNVELLEAIRFEVDFILITNIYLSINLLLTSFGCSCALLNYLDRIPSKLRTIDTQEQEALHLIIV